MKKLTMAILAVFTFFLFATGVRAEMTDEVATVTGSEPQTAVASSNNAMSLNELENANEQTVKQDEIKPEKNDKKDKKEKKHKKEKKQKKEKREKSSKPKKQAGSKKNR